MTLLFLQLSKLILVNTTSRVSYPQILNSRAFCVKCTKPRKCDGKKCNRQLDNLKKKCGCLGITSTPGCPAKQYEWKGCKSEEEKEDVSKNSTRSKNSKIKKP